MPELPEVETVRRTLERQIIGKKITSVDVYYDKIIENVPPSEFISKLKNQTFRQIDCYGKYLIFILDQVSILSHLRMEGKFFIKEPNAKLEKHEHIVFTLDEKISFRYHDTRKFGKMALLETTNKEEIMQYPALIHLGKEANDESFTSMELYQVLSTKHMPIKTALLDQEVICGLGNIYADEVCFLSKISPKTACNMLSIEDAKNILDASKAVLAKAIQAGGTTIRSYTSSLGITGLFQLELLVHSRVAKPCPTCKTPIVKIKVGGRGTYFCPKCQPIKNKKVIGITGSIATGKSVVSNYLKELGYPVIDADEIVKEGKKKNHFLYKALLDNIASFDFLTNGEIDNQKLAKFIYEKDENRLLVNEVVHPLVKKEMERQIENTFEEIVFVSVPLLFEAHFEDLCDQIICVYAQEEVEIKRLMARNHLSYEEAALRISKQAPQKEKCERANFIIDNSKELCYTIEQVDKMLRKVKKTYGNE